MSRKNMGGLIVLNAVLIAVLGVLSFTPQPAEAQLGGRRPGDYIMVAGMIPGQTNSALYITDLNNGAMLAVTYDIGRRSLMTLGGRDLSADLR